MNATLKKLITGILNPFNLKDKNNYIKMCNNAQKFLDYMLKQNRHISYDTDMDCAIIKVHSLLETIKFSVDYEYPNFYLHDIDTLGKILPILEKSIIGLYYDNTDKITANQIFKIWEE